MIVYRVYKDNKYIGTVIDVFQARKLANEGYSIEVYGGGVKL